MLSAESYFDNYNFAPIYEQVLKENKVSPDDIHHQRHTIEIKKKVDEIKKSYKSREFFKEMPNLDNDFSSYVILTNMPFVEEEKRDKFKMYMSKKVGEDIEKKIKEYIFPYTNDDKDYFANNSFIIIKFGSFEEAKLASIALNDFQIDKSHKVNATTYIEFDDILSMQDSYIAPDYFSFVDLVNWEESNLIEMFMARRNKSIFLGKLHYLKKELDTFAEIPNKIQNVSWSPQGKYLAVNEGNSLKLYGGSSAFDVKLELDYAMKDFILSNDEKYVITFSGYAAEKENQKQNVFIWDLIRKELIRDLTITKEENFGHFKWSKDSQYFGRIKKDILIIYEAPKMQMLPDSQGVRQPIKDNVKDFHWFPNRNNIVTISEKRSGNKLNESILQFFEMPSRKSFSSSSLSGLEIISLEWHKNNNYLAVLCKSTDKNPKWSIRMFEIDNVKHSFRSAHTNLIIGDGTGQFYSLSIRWMGNDVLIAPKFRDNGLESMHVLPYKMDRKTLQILPWAEENFLKNLKHSHFLPSPNEAHFLLACMDQNNSNNFGKVDLFVVDSGKLNFCKSYEFTNNLESVKWDHGGRLFLIELTRKQQEGIKFYDCLGNLIYDFKGENITMPVWRPRHLPLLDRNLEEADIKKNFKNIAKIFEEEDSQFLSAIDQFRRNERKQTRDRFMLVVNKRREIWIETKEARDKLHKEPEAVYVEHEYVLEEILHTVEEIISTD